MTKEIPVHWVCQACRQAPAAEDVRDDDPVEPYRLCHECADRLRYRALRPIEWFNLAALHGWAKFLLHDDFYDQDGRACQPDVDDDVIDEKHAPTLEMCARSLERLIDFCVTRWHLGKEEFEAFRPFPIGTVLAAIEHRADAGNRQVWETMVQLCANVVGSPAAPWVRAQFNRAWRDVSLFIWAEAAAKCLPAPEGLHKTIDALQVVHGRDLEKQMSALSWFRAAAVLDWIEAHLPPQDVAASWGQLASLSDLHWSRVQSWLASGRPLSLVALDALASCIPRQGQARILTILDPKLKGCGDRSVIGHALRIYEAEDSAPRVATKCSFIIQHLDKLRAE
ncbi:hypothetical protein [Bradyrhizobium sp. WSM1743]|uniref:hypothetical protein n=1 Tax=Bradyrhizobium sp. WSM1743 TaxID=318996 RepID=UPI000417B96C|nr:hypothetical protein [Bradyrhizobium sp. WSM1743]